MHSQQFSILIWSSILNIWMVSRARKQETTEQLDDYCNIVLTYIGIYVTFNLLDGVDFTSDLYWRLKCHFYPAILGQLEFVWFQSPSGDQNGIFTPPIAIRCKIHSIWPIKMEFSNFSGRFSQKRLNLECTKLVPPTHALTQRWHTFEVDFIQNSSDVVLLVV